MNHPGATIPNLCRFVRKFNLETRLFRNKPDQGSGRAANPRSPRADEAKRSAIGVWGKRTNAYVTDAGRTGRNRRHSLWTAWHGDSLISACCLALFFAAALALCARVYLYGDDFFYATFTGRGPGYLLRRMIEHYQLANGRVAAHLLAAAFLSMDLWVWRAANSLGLAACAWLCSRVATPQGCPRWPGVMIAASLLLLIDISVARQSIYWLDGSCNYLYPLLMLLTYWLALRRFLARAAGSPLLPVLAFLASATTEQGGMMAFGLTLLLLAHYRLVQGGRLRLRQGAIVLCSLLGLLTVVCAPGVFHRIAMTESPVNGGLWQLAAYNLRLQGASLFSPATGLFWLLMLAAGIGYAAARAGKRGWRDVAFDPTMPAALLLGLGSQAVMLVSPVYGPRVLLSFLVMAVVFIIRAASRFSGGRAYRLLLAALIIAAACNWYGLYRGYGENAVVYRDNMAAIGEYREEEGALLQRQLPGESYGWVMPYHNGYYDAYYKLCFDLPAATRIIWLPAGQGK